MTSTRVAMLLTAQATPNVDRTILVESQGDKEYRMSLIFSTTSGGQMAEAADPPAGGNRPGREPNRNGGTFDTVAKLLTGSVGLLAGAATALSAASGGLAFLFRNDPARTRWAIVLAGFATAIALLVSIIPDRLSSSWWRRAAGFGASAALLVAALVLVGMTQYDLQSVSSRPVISTEWTTVGGGSAIKVSIEATSLAQDDQLFASVALYAEGQPTQFPYSGATGPDSDGNAKQVEVVPIPTKVGGHDVDLVQVVAAIVKGHLLPGTNVLSLACSGTIYTESTPPASLPPTTTTPKATGSRTQSQTPIEVASPSPSPLPSGTPKIVPACVNLKVIQSSSGVPSTST